MKQTNDTTRSAHGTQLVAFMCVDHMIANDQNWPESWDDLKDDGQRIVMCKITGDLATWKMARQKFGLQRADQGMKWRMESSSVRGDLFWWPRSGESAIYYANEH